MKLTLRLPGVNAIYVNLFLVLCSVIALYGPVNVRKGTLATTTSSNIDNANEVGKYSWDGLEYKAGGVTQYLMYADAEECDNQDNNDNGINMMCSRCNSAGRKIAGASTVSLAFLGLGSGFGMLRMVGLDTLIRPDTPTGSGLMFYEISSHLVATCVMTLGVFVWGTDCLAQIQGRDNNVKPSGFNMAIISAAFMGLTTYLCTFIKRHEKLWRFHIPGGRWAAYNPAAMGEKPAGKLNLGPTSSSAVILDVGETSSTPSSPQLSTTSLTTDHAPPARGPPARGPPARGPPAARGPPKSSPPPRSTNSRGPPPPRKPWEQQ